MKRLLCIISSMNAGGAETFLMKVYRQLDKSKYQMDFCISESKKGFYNNEICEMGGKIYVIPCKSQNVRLFKKMLKEIVFQNQYKYVMRITSNALGFYDLKIAKKAGAERCIVRSSNSSDGGSYKKLAHIIGKLLFKKYIDVKIAPSDLAAKYTFGKKDYKNHNVKILHNALDLNAYQYSLEWREVIRKELGIIEDTFVVGHVGRFSKQKNHMFLLEIFSQICIRKNSAMLLLIGQGELKKEIVQCAKKLGIDKKIIFAGIRKDIPQLLSAMDILVFPSLYEGMPNTVIEAQATGLPCIIADTITKEADITGLVKYESLNKSATEWAKEAMEIAKKPRINTKEKFIHAGYDIESVTKEFEQMIFE